MCCLQLIQIYEGGAELDGDVVEALRGSDVTDDSGESQPTQVRVFGSRATVNYRSRATAGTHFNASWWYSFDCPAGFHIGKIGRSESGFSIGDKIGNSPDASVGVLAYGVAVLGSWTSLILTEQVIYHHLSGDGSTWMWIALSASSLGVAMWSSIVIGAASIDVGGLSILYFVFASVFSVLVSASACGLAMTLIVFKAKVMDRKLLNADQNAYKQLLLDTAVGAPIKPDAHLSLAAQSPSERVVAALKLFDLYLCIGGMLLMTGLGGVHFIILNGMVLACDSKYNVAINIVALAFGVVFLTVAIFLYYAFRTSQWRFVSAFIMALGIVSFHFIAASGVDYRYTGADLPTSDDYMNSASMQLMGSIATALMCFLFVGLNVIRLKLSRDQLDADVQDRDFQIRELEERVRTYEAHLSDLQRKIALTALARPLIRPNHFLLHAIAADAERQRTANAEAQAAGSGGGSGADDSQLVRMDSKRDDAKKSSAAGAGPSSPLSSSGIGATSFSVGASLSLHEILSNPVCVELLKDKMQANMNVENLAFLLDVEAYKQAWAGENEGSSGSGLPLWSFASGQPTSPVAAAAASVVGVVDGTPGGAGISSGHNPMLPLTNDRLRAMACDIFWNYIPENSAYQVNISAECRTALAKKYVQTAAPAKTPHGDAAAAAIMASKTGTKAVAMVAAAAATALSPIRSGASKPARDVFAAAERESTSALLFSLSVCLTRRA